MSTSSSSLHSSPLRPSLTRSITETYFLAHMARNKLAFEASRSDHRLSRLVGHANLLDSLMFKLGRVENDLQQWQYISESDSISAAEATRHVQWANCVVEEPEEDWQASDAESSDSESDYDSDEENEMEADVVSLQRISSHKVLPTLQYSEENEGAFEVLDMKNGHSHPPELDLDSDSSEDDNTPPTPTTALKLSFDKKSSTVLFTKAESPSSIIPPSEQQAFFDEGYYLPRRTCTDLGTAISVC